MILNFLSIVFFAAGLLFFTGTVMGVIRFPDFYTRIHAAAKGDTLSSLLLLMGIVCQLLSEPSLTTLLTCGKLVFIIAFIFVASPTATHAIIEAGYVGGMAGWTPSDQNPRPTEVVDGN